MMRVLLVLAATLPRVLSADTEVIPPSCAHPADLQDRLGDNRGDYIVFTRGIDLRSSAMTLLERFAIPAYAPGKWNGLDDAIRVPRLTPTQIAELRCESVVELVVHDVSPPVQSAEDRPYTKVRLGIAIRPVGDEEAGGRLPRGVAITSVGPDSVAFRAGLLAKDYILKFDDHEVNSMQDLWNVMAGKNPGDADTIVILRDGNKISVIVQF